MLKTTRLLALLLSASMGFTAAQTTSGPFGIPFGLSRAEAVAQMPLVEYRHGNFLTQQVPNPNSLFPNYLLIISEAYGVCAVQGYTDPLELNDKNAAVELFDQLKTTLGRVYGPPTRVDETARDDPGGYEPADFGGLSWQEKIELQHVRLDAYWNPVKGKVFPGLLEIQMGTEGLATREELRVGVGYISEDYDDCIKDLQGVSRKGL